MSIEQPPAMRRVEDEPKPPIDSQQEPLLPMPELEDSRIETYIHEHSNEHGFEGARQKIIDMLQLVKEDPRAVEMITATLESIFRYVETIYKMEVQTRMLSLRWEGQELRDKIKTHDDRRRRAHDALISNLIACTRYLNEHFFHDKPSAGIYSGDPQHLVEKNRIAIGDWAIEVEHEILLARPK